MLTLPNRPEIDGRIALAAVLAGLLLAGAGVCRAAPGEPGGGSVEARAPRAPAWGELLDDGPDWSSAPLGEGRLGPPFDLPDLGTDWLRELVVPLYSAPDRASRWGRLAGGWLVEKGGVATPLPAGCLVETGYATASFVVLEERDDGNWLRIALHPPCDEGGLWLRPEEAESAAAPLVSQSWAALFLEPGLPALYLRSPESAVLRDAPQPGAAAVTTLGRDASLHPLEVRGDWMRVRAAVPSDACTDPAAWQGERWEGWLRWRRPGVGPVLWYPPRGC